MRFCTAILGLWLAGCGGGGGATDGDGDADSDSDSDSDSDGDCTRDLPPEGDALTRVGRLRVTKADGSALNIETMAVTADGDRAYVCTNRWSIAALDLTSPELSRLSFTDRLVCQHVVAEGGGVFVANHGTSLDPDVALRSFGTTLVERDAVREPGVLYEGVDVEGDLLAVAEHERGLELFTVDAGGAMTSAAVVAGFTNAFAVKIQDGLAYVADGAGGIRIVDVGTPASASIVGSVETTEPATEIDVDGDALVAAVSAAGTDVFRLDDPLAPTFVATVDTLNTTTDVAVLGGRLYTAEWNEVRVFDLGAVDCDPLLLAVESDSVQDDFSRTFGVHPLDDGLLVAGWETLSRYALDLDVGGSEVAVSKPVLTWGTPGDGSDTQVVLVENEGDRDLAISGADVTGADFSVGPIPETVLPGDFGFFEATFTPSGLTPAEGEITLHTSDPDEPNVSIALAGNVPGLGVGDVFPDTELVEVETGTHVMTSELLGAPVLLAYFATF